MVKPRQRLAVGTCDIHINGFIRGRFHDTVDTFPVYGLKLATQSFVECKLVRVTECQHLWGSPPRNWSASEYSVTQISSPACAEEIFVHEQSFIK